MLLDAGSKVKIYFWQILFSKSNRLFATMSAEVEALPTTSSREGIPEPAENVIEDFLMSMAKKGYIATRKDVR